MQAGPPTPNAQTAAAAAAPAPAAVSMTPRPSELKAQLSKLEDAVDRIHHSKEGALDIKASALLRDFMAQRAQIQEQGEAKKAAIRQQSANSGGASGHTQSNSELAAVSEWVSTEIKKLERAYHADVNAAKQTINADFAGKIAKMNADIADARKRLAIANANSPKHPHLRKQTSTRMTAFFSASKDDDADSNSDSDDEDGRAKKPVNLRHTLLRQASSIVGGGGHGIGPPGAFPGESPINKLRKGVGRLMNSMVVTKGSDGNSPLNGGGARDSPTSNGLHMPTLGGVLPAIANRIRTISTGSSSDGGGGNRSRTSTNELVNTSASVAIVPGASPPVLVPADPSAPASNISQVSGSSSNSDNNSNHGNLSASGPSGANVNAVAAITPSSLFKSNIASAAAPVMAVSSSLPVDGNDKDSGTTGVSNINSSNNNNNPAASTILAGWAAARKSVSVQNLSTKNDEADSDDEAADEDARPAGKRSLREKRGFGADSLPSLVTSPTIARVNSIGKTNNSLIANSSKRNSAITTAVLLSPSKSNSNSVTGSSGFAVTQQRLDGLLAEVAAVTQQHAALKADLQTLIAEKDAAKQTIEEIISGRVKQQIKEIETQTQASIAALTQSAEFEALGQANKRNEQTLMVGRLLAKREKQIAKLPKKMKKEKKAALDGVDADFKMVEEPMKQRLKEIASKHALLLKEISDIESMMVQMKEQQDQERQQVQLLQQRDFQQKDRSISVDSAALPAGVPTSVQSQVPLLTPQPPRSRKSIQPQGLTPRTQLSLLTPQEQPTMQPQSQSPSVQAQRPPHFTKQQDPVEQQLLEELPSMSSLSILMGTTTSPTKATKQPTPAQPQAPPSLSPSPRANLRLLKQQQQQQQQQQQVAASAGAVSSSPVSTNTANATGSPAAKVSIVSVASSPGKPITKKLTSNPSPVVTKLPGKAVASPEKGLEVSADKSDAEPATNTPPQKKTMTAADFQDLERRQQAELQRFKQLLHGSSGNEDASDDEGNSGTSSYYYKYVLATMQQQHQQEQTEAVTRELYSDKLREGVMVTSVPAAALPQKESIRRNIVSATVSPKKPAIIKSNDVGGGSAVEDALGFALALYQIRARCASRVIRNSVYRHCIVNILRARKAELFRQKQIACCITLQSLARCFLGKLALKRLRRKKELYAQKVLEKRRNRVATAMQAWWRGVLGRRYVRVFARQRIVELRTKARALILKCILRWIQRYHLRRVKYEQLIGQILTKCLFRRMQRLRSAAKYRHIQHKRETIERVNATKIVPKGLTTQLLQQMSDAEDSSLAKQILSLSQALTTPRKSGKVELNVGSLDSSRRLQVVTQFQQQQQKLREEADVNSASGSPEALLTDTAAPVNSVVRNRQTIVLKKVSKLMGKSIKMLELEREQQLHQQHLT
jgi:hypothetical protein